MKCFSLILAVYIIVLGFSPCTDFEQPCNHETELPSGHDHHDHSKDTCPPFCVCSCCGVFISLPEPGLTLKEPVIPIIPLRDGFFANSYSHTYQSSIWQPPANS